MTATIERVTGPELYSLISQEILDSISEEGREIMARSLHNSSMVWVGFDGDKLLGFWGLISPTLISQRAYLWLYTTPALQSHEFIFIRHSQRAVAEMLKEYPIIIGHGMVGADKSLRWLEWLGAKFGAPEGQLLPFEIRAV